MDTPKSSASSGLKSAKDINSSQSRRSGTRKKTLNTPIRQSHYELFNKRKEIRDAQDKRRMVKVIESLKFFDKETLSTIKQNQLMNKLLDRLRYEEFPASKAIYHEGDPCNMFYIIMKGKVRLYVPRTIEEIEEDKVKVSNHSTSTPLSTNLKSSKLSSARSKDNFASVPQSPFTASKRPQNSSASQSIFASQAQKSSSNPKRQSRDAPSPYSPTHKSILQISSSLSDKVKSASPTKVPSSTNLTSVNAYTNHLLWSSLMKVKNSDSPTKTYKKKNLKTEEDEFDTQKKVNGSGTTHRASTFRPSHLKLSVNTRLAASTNIINSAHINESIATEDQQILSRISKPNKKYVLSHKICAYKLHQELNFGASFGQIMQKSGARKETAVAVDTIHVLVLSAQDYLELFEEPLKERRDRIEIFKKVFSGKKFDDVFLVKFADLFQAKKYELKDRIYTQAEPVLGLYMVRDGEVRIVKNEAYMTDPSTRKLQKSTLKRFEVAKLAPYQFFGTETLLGFDQRNFTAETASMSLDLLFLDISFLKEQFHYTRDFITAITKMSQIQYEHQNQHVQQAREYDETYGKNLAKLHTHDEKFVLKREVRHASSNRIKDQAEHSNNEDHESVNRFKTRRIRPTKPLQQVNDTPNDASKNQSSFVSSIRNITPSKLEHKDIDLTHNTFGDELDMSKSRVYHSMGNLNSYPTSESRNNLHDSAEHQSNQHDLFNSTSLTLVKDNPDPTTVCKLKLVKEKPIKVIDEKEKPPLPRQLSLWKYNMVTSSSKYRYMNLRSQNMNVDYKTEASQSKSQRGGQKDQNNETTKKFARSGSAPRGGDQSLYAHTEQNSRTKNTSNQNDVQDQYVIKKLQFFLTRMKNETSRPSSVNNTDRSSLIAKYSNHVQSQAIVGNDHEESVYNSRKYLLDNQSRSGQVNDTLSLHHFADQSSFISRDNNTSRPQTSRSGMKITSYPQRPITANHYNTKGIKN